MGKVICSDFNFLCLMSKGIVCISFKGYNKYIGKDDEQVKSEEGGH